MKRLWLIPAMIFCTAWTAWASVPDEDTVAGPYACDGSDTTFTFSFGLVTENDLQVYLVDEDGVETLLTLATDYTVTGANTNDELDLTKGGTVTTIETYSDDYRIVIRRDTERTSDLDIDDEVIQEAVEKLTRIAQDLSERLGRCLQIQVIDSGDTVQLPPAGTAGYVYRDADGNFTTALGTGASVLDELTAFWLSRVQTDANATEARSGLGLVIGEDVQAYDPNLAEIADLDAVAVEGDYNGEYLYWSYLTDTWNRIQGTSAGRKLLGIATPEATDNVLARWKSNNWSPLDLTSFWETRISTDANNAEFSIARQSGVYNVMHYGAVGDGVTDDTTAIQAADIAAGAANSVLFFPAGTYLISGSIACNAREYLGDGSRNSLIVQSTSSTPIFYHTGGTSLGDRKWRQLGFATSAAAVTDVAAFKSELPSSAYMSYCTWEDCEFYRGLKYGIHANLIFATINRCRFGYLDNFAESWNDDDVHVALWSPGSASKYSNINHVQESQFFCAKGGAAAVVLSVGTNWLFTSCDWELLDAPAVYASGIFGLTFRNCHFEKITPAGGEEYLVYGATSTITTRPVIFDSCIISLTDSTGVTAIYEGSSAANTYTEFKRCVIWFDDKYLTKVGSKYDEGVGRLENNLFYDYAGVLNAASRDNYALPVVAREGLLADPWLTGWSLTNLQGWSKAAITSWDRGSYDGYPGGTIAYTTSGAGYNFMYVTLTAAEYQGKRIGIQGIATRATGTAAALRLGYNFTQETPTSMTTLEGGFNQTTPVSLYREVEVPADADYVHVGFASGGWAGTGHIIAFNVWEVQATSPTPALVVPQTEVYNVKAYGAVGDGETDDTTAIQAAIDAAEAASGGVVYCPTGTYNVTGLTVRDNANDGITIQGDDAQRSIIQMMSTGNALTIDTNWHYQITVRDIAFTADYDALSEDYVADCNGIHIEKAQNMCSFERVRISRFERGINVGVHVNMLHIMGCTLTYNNIALDAYGNYSDGIVVDCCYIWSNFYRSIMWTSPRMIVQNCIIDGDCATTQVVADPDDYVAIQVGVQAFRGSDQSKCTPTSPVPGQGSYGRLSNCFFEAGSSLVPDANCIILFQNVTTTTAGYGFLIEGCSFANYAVPYVIDVNRTQYDLQARDNKAYGTAGSWRSFAKVTATDGFYNYDIDNPLVAEDFFGYDEHIKWGMTPLEFDSIVAPKSHPYGGTWTAPAENGEGSVDVAYDAYGTIHWNAVRTGAAPYLVFNQNAAPSAYIYVSFEVRADADCAPGSYLTYALQNTTPANVIRKLIYPGAEWKRVTFGCPNPNEDDQIRLYFSSEDRNCNLYFRNFELKYTDQEIPGTAAPDSFAGGIEVRNGTNPGHVDFYEGSGNGANYIRLIGPASTDTDTLILPTAAEIAEAGYLYCAADGTITTSTPAGAGDFLADGSVPMTGSLYITEAAAASADSAGLGQIWVKNATPSELWYTDDAGTDFQLGVVGAIDTTTVDAPTWSDGANASNIWSFDVSGTDPAITFGDGVINVSAGTLQVGGASVFYAGHDINLETAADPTIYALDTTNNARIQLQASDTDTWLSTTSNHPLKIETNDTLRLTIAADGTTWTYEAGASDPVWTISSGIMNLSTGTLQEGGSAVATASDNLSVFAATTSAQLYGVLSDETGTGAAVFADSPTFADDITIQAAGVKLTGDGDGALTILGLGDGSDEDWVINLDDTANEVTHSSGTGVLLHHWSGIAGRFGLNGGNAAQVVMTLTNTDETSDSETDQTSSLLFQLTGSINEADYAAAEAARIEAYKVSDWYADGTADHDSGLKFYTTNNNTPALAMTISNAGVITAAGSFTGALTGNVTGDVSGNAGTVTNGVYTTDAGSVFLAPDGDGSSLTSVDAATGDSATGFFDAGTIEHEYGGLEADVHEYSGLLAVSGGATSEVNSKSELEAQIADVADFAEADGDTYSNAHDFSSATVTLPARTAGLSHHFRFNIINPNAAYDLDTQICICPKLPAAITITNIEVTCNADPTTELDLDLKWADTFIGLANAAVIDVIDTTNGVTSISAGFDDADVASGKCIYVEFGAEPDEAITQVCIDITYDYDS